MSIEKAEIKIGTVNQIGSKLDDMLEQSEAEMRRCEGAKGSLRQAAKAISDLTAHVNKDVDEGRLDFGEETLKVAAEINRWIQRCSAVAENLAVKAEVAFLINQGKADGLRASVQVASQIKQQEEQKISARQNGSSEERVAGEHPSKMSAVADIQARRAEASNGADADEPKRRPGRPKGSKNRPKETNGPDA